MTRRWSVVGAAVFAALGCREAPTRIAVRVDSPGLREVRDLSTVDVTARLEGAGSQFPNRTRHIDFGDGVYRLPGEVLVTPLSATDPRRVILTVVGTLARGGPQITQEFVTGFERGRTTVIYFRLTELCAGVDCGDGRTCVPTETGVACAERERPIVGEYVAETPDALVWADAVPTDIARDGDARDADEGAVDVAGGLDASTDEGGRTDALDVATDDGGSVLPDADGGDGRGAEDADADGGHEDVADACEGATCACPPGTTTACGGSCAPCVGGLPAPRPLAPLSSAVVTTQRPTLRWTVEAPDGGVGDAGVTGAQIELCRDRACLAPLVTLRTLGPGSMRLGAEVPAGTTVVFWRLRYWDGTRVGTATSPTWEFWMPRGPLRSVTDTSWGTGPTDIDGDGAEDVLLRDGSNRVFIYWGQPGLSGLGPGLMLSRSDAEGASAIVGDLNGDGLADVMQGASGSMDVYYGRSGRSIGGPDATVSPLGRAWTNLRRVGDVDGDGLSDVLLCEEGAGYIYYGKPFEAPPARQPFRSRMQLVAPSGAERFCHHGAAPGDMDGDGLADVVVSGLNTRSYVYFDVAAAPDAGATAQAVLTAGGNYEQGAGDLDGDGFGDLVAGGSAGVQVYFGARDRDLTRRAVPLTRPSGWNGSLEIDGGDFDGDGLGDVVVGFDPDRVALYRGALAGFGTHGFAWTQSGRFGYSVRARDLNADGYMDVVVAANTGNTVYAYQGGPSAALSNTPNAVVPSFVQAH